MSYSNIRDHKLLNPSDKTSPIQFSLQDSNLIEQFTLKHPHTMINPNRFFNNTSSHNKDLNGMINALFIAITNNYTNSLDINIIEKYDSKSIIEPFQAFIFEYKFIKDSPNNITLYIPKDASSIVGYTDIQEAILISILQISHDSKFDIYNDGVINANPRLNIQQSKYGRMTLNQILTIAGNTWNMFDLF